MIICKYCGNEVDENKAAGICPNCGGELIDSFAHTVGFEKDDKTSKAEEEKVEDPRWLKPGVILNNRYEIVKVIGAGGFGITYKVLDTKQEVFKCVKEYFQNGVVNRIPGEKEVLISAPNAREQFEYGRERLLREAQIVAKFQSPSIVRVDDYFEENNTSYMVMEYLETLTLEDYVLQRKAPLDPETAINVGVKICDALEEIHNAGVIHRDIAPDNIFINDDGEVKIIDFGSARLSKDDTDDRLIVLKPGFSPPEQYEKIDLSNDRQQAWTDIYALGATLYMTLTGKVPAEASDRKIDMDNDTDRVPYPDKINPSVPEFLANTVMKAMAIQIHERFKESSELKEALLQERKVVKIEVERENIKKRRKRTICSGIIAAVLVVAIGINVFIVRQDDFILDPADITVWYAIDENETVGTEKASVLDTLNSEILNSDKFSEVSINLVGIPETEYEDRLLEAYASGTMPDVFESVDSDAAYLEGTEPAKNVTSYVENGTTYFVEEYVKNNPDAKEVPMGFNIPVIYLNTALVSDYSEDIQIASMEDFMKLDAGEMQYMPIGLNEVCAEAYGEMFDDFSSYEASMKQYTLEDFINNEVVAYFSDTSDYYYVRDKLPANFEMIPIASDEVICQFTDCWAVSSNDDEAVVIASEEFVAYMLSNNAQDKYYLQTSNIAGLPLERAALTEYGDVNRPVKSMIEDVSFYVVR